MSQSLEVIISENKRQTELFLAELQSLRYIPEYSWRERQRTIDRKYPDGHLWNRVHSAANWSEFQLERMFFIMTGRSPDSGRPLL